MNLFESVADMVVTADDMGDSHFVIIDDHRQIINGAAIAATNHKILDFGILTSNIAEQHIFIAGFTLVNFKSDSACFAGIKTIFYFVFR